MSNAELARGWAVSQGGKILIDTVSISRRAAIINYLVVYMKIRVYSVLPDKDIKNLWTMRSADVIVHEVTVEFYTP